MAVISGSMKTTENGIREGLVAGGLERMRLRDTDVCVGMGTVTSRVQCG
jgi:hypothetical protein